MRNHKIERLVRASTREKETIYVKFIINKNYNKLEILLHVWNSSSPCLL